MKNYDKMKVEKIEEVLTSVTCDVCSEEIKDGKTFYSVIRGHKDWGNDSHEATEFKDICSDDCLKEEINDYISQDSDTKYIEIKKGYLRGLRSNDKKRTNAKSMQNMWIFKSDTKR